MKLLSSLMAFLLLAGSCHAATLSELQQRALENRAVIERYKANLSKSQEEQKIARSGYLPSFDIAYTANHLAKNSLIEEKENSIAYGALTWNLFSGFKDKYNIQSAKLLRDAEAFKLKGIEQDIQLNVSLRYLNIFALKANMHVTEDMYNTLLKSYQDAQNRFSVGIIKKSELLKFLVDLNDAEITKKKAWAELNKSIQRLEREVGTSLSLEELIFTEFRDLPQIDGQKNYEDEMFNNRSEIKVLEETMKAYKARVKGEYARLYPSVDLTSSYRKYDDDYINSQGDNYEEEIRTQVVVSINLFDGFEKYSKVRKAKFESQAIRYDLEEVKQDLATELKNLFLDYAVSIDTVPVAQSSIEQAEENLRVSRIAYREGLETESELLDAISNLSRAKYSFVAAKSAVFANYFKIIRSIEGF